MIPTTISVDVSTKTRFDILKIHLKCHSDDLLNSLMDLYEENKKEGRLE